jgi:hypothetical protein
VSQGSIFASLFYVNDLPVNIQESRIILFVDETNIRIIAEYEQILQQKIEL